MAHLASVYPFHVDDGLGDAGPYVGVSVTGGMGGFYFDPFELYTVGTLTNPNVIVTGDIGSGKSALVKAFLRRSLAVYGPRRFVAILDPKGEYTSFAAAHGLPVVQAPPRRYGPPQPDGPAPGRRPVQRHRPTGTGYGAGCRRARPTARRDRGCTCSDGRSRPSAARAIPFTLVDVTAAITDPADELIALSRRTPLELAQAATPVVFALDKLCSRTLAGMFDGPTTVALDWDRGPGIVDRPLRCLQRPRGPAPRHARRDVVARRCAAT